MIFSVIAAGIAFAGGYFVRGICDETKRQNIVERKHRNPFTPRF